MPFQLESNYKPRGDQGQAIAKLIRSSKLEIAIRRCSA
jgi:excinuclease UvrABC helicase subunit UvrB